MKKSSYLNRLALVFLAMILTACGSSGGGATPNMTLGITSLGSGTTTAKPSLASNWIGKAVDFFSVNEAVANNNNGTCTDPTSGAFLKITDATTPADMIWITRAYAILEEIEFEDDDNSHDDAPDNNIQHAIDLLANDSNVAEEVGLVVPTGITVNQIKFKVQRLEDDTLNLLRGVTDQAQFLTDIGYNEGIGKRVRPSIILKGDIKDATGCHTFRFVADGRFRTTVPFASGQTFDPASVKGVLQFNIVQAFKDSGISVSALVGELGFQSPAKELPVNADFLDGRTKDGADKTGSTNAVLWAKQLTTSWEVFTKPLNTDNSIDGSDGAATQVTVDDGDPLTDDNPSCSDVANPAVTACT